MQLNFLLNKFFLIVSKVLIYFLMFYLVSLLLSPVPDSFRFYLAFIFSLTTIILLQQRITAKTQEIIDRLLYPQIFRLNRNLTRFNKKLNTIIEYDLLLNQIEAFLAGTFSKHRYALYLYRHNSFELYFHSDDKPAIPVIIEFDLESHRPEIFKTEPKVYAIEKISERDENSRSLLKSFSGFYHYLIPLVSFKNAMGFLLIDKSFHYYLNFPDTKNLLIHVFQKMADFIENTAIYSNLKRNSLESALLLNIAKKITATLDLNEVLDSMIESLSQLVSYNSAGIFLVEKEKGILRYMATRGYDQRVLDKIPVKINQGIAGKVIKTKRPHINPDVSNDTSYFRVRSQTRSQITVPIFSGEDVIGVIVLESDEINHFTQADLELLTAFSSLASIALSNAQLYEDSFRKKQLESELLVASSIQKALLPQRVTSITGIQIEAFNISSEIVSGDLFDVVRLDKSHLSIAIGDVSGKGAPAAILMSVVYAGFKSLLKEIYEVSEIVARLNNLLVETTTQGYFATFFFGIINREKNSLTYCNAGHNFPLLIRKSQRTRFLKTGGILLGFLPGQVYRQQTVSLKSGDYLLLYTDGVTEVKNSAGEEFGEQRLVRIMKKNYGKTPVELKEIILKQIRKFSGTSRFPDDITLIILYYE